MGEKGKAVSVRLRNTNYSQKCPFQEVSKRVLQLELPEHGVRLLGNLRKQNKNPIGWDNWAQLEDMAQG